MAGGVLAGMLGTGFASDRPAAEAVLREQAPRLAPLLWDSYLPGVALRTALLELTGTPDDLLQTFTEYGAGIVGLPGCRVHSCTEKGFALIDLPAKKLLAFGLRHFQCRYKFDRNAPIYTITATTPIACDPEEDATLTIAVVVPDTGTLSDAVLRERVAIVRAWARAFPYKVEHVFRICYATPGDDAWMRSCSG